MDNSWKNFEREKRIVAGWPKFRKFLLALLCFSFLTLAWSAFDLIWRGGDIVGIIFSLGQIFLVSGMIFNGAAIRLKENQRRNNIISFVLLVPSAICICYSLWSNLFTV